MRDQLRTGVGATALCLALIALTPALAGDNPAKEGETRIVVKRIGEGRSVTVDGVDVAELRAKCQGRGATSDVSTEDKGDRTRTRIVICNQDKTRSKASLIGALESARRELAGEEHLSVTHRNRATAALDAEIARVRDGE